MGSEERKLAEDQRASLEELKDMLEHIETDAMPADMMAVLLKHLPRRFGFGFGRRQNRLGEAEDTFVGLTRRVCL